MHKVVMLRYYNSLSNMSCMSVDAIPTVRDETKSAVAALDTAAVEISRWRDHLLRIHDEGDDNPGIAHQARRSGQIVAALIHQAQDHTSQAGHQIHLRAEDYQSAAVRTVS